MISWGYDIYEFLENLKGKSLLNAIIDTQQELGETHQFIQRRNIDKPRHQKAVKYDIELRGLAYFFGNAVHPAGISDGLFYSFVKTVFTFDNLNTEPFEKFKHLLKEE